MWQVDLGMAEFKLLSEAGQQLEKAEKAQAAFGASLPEAGKQARLS